ncbi:MAG: hypothetical protein R3Y35_11735 [Clostridia bacterium]
MKRIQVKRKTFNMLLLLFPIAIFSKWYQYVFTGGASFGIMAYIKNIVDTGVEIGMDSYDFPAKVYSLFKFLGFTTHLEWSVFFTAIFTIILFVMLLRYEDYTIFQYIFIYASMFLLCWLVMNMNKDLIQLIFILIIFKICTLRISNSKKMIISSLVCLYESLVFRNYYIILAGMIIVIYYILNKNLTLHRKPNYARDIFLVLIVFFAGIFIIGFIMPEAYDNLVNRREGLEGFEGSVNTIITNVIPGNSFPIFMANYCINFLRILFPFELIGLGINQIVFFAYQMSMTIILIISMRKINKENIAYITIILAYVVMMGASESDFGTLARHQAVIFMFFLALFKNSDKKKEIENVETPLTH